MVLITGEGEKEVNSKDSANTPHTPTCNLSRTMSPSPEAVALITRQKANTTTAKKMQKELEDAEGQNTDMQSKQQAIDFLTAKQYLIPGNPIDLQALAYVLLQLGCATNRILKQVVDRIRAVAFLLANASAQQIADEIMHMVKNQLQEHIEVFTLNVENMQDTVKHVMAATDKITGKIDEFTNEFQETTEQIAQATQELAEKASESANKAATEITAPPLANQPSTYAAAAQQEPHADHAEVIT